MNLLAIISLLSSLIGGISNSQKAQEAEDYQKKVDEVNQKNLDIQIQNRKKEEREARRRALASSIGSKNVFYSSPDAMPIGKPEAPDLSGYDTVSGIANIAGQTASSWNVDQPEWMKALNRSVNAQKSLKSNYAGPDSFSSDIQPA